MTRLLPLLFSVALLPTTGLRANERILELTLEDCRQLVIQNNLEIAAQKLGWESAQALYRGEREALWEPALVLSAERERNERENNSEQFVAQGVEDFEEENNIYRLAVEQPLATGGQFQLGYTYRDLDNNLREQRELEGPDRDSEAFLGLVFTQPLLRDGGTHITRSMVEMARKESEATFQEWRRQMMQTIGSAEAAYWELHIARRRVELREDSVRVAEQILEDNRARFEAGRAGEVEVQQAEAGLALREAQLLEARQNVVDASTRLKTFFSEIIRDEDFLIRTLDVPLLEETHHDPHQLFEEAKHLHPDILLRRHRLEQEDIRMNFAKNQTLPELNLQASYGYNGLGESSSEAWDTVTDRDFPSWSVGVSLRVPLGGGRRARREFEASRHRHAQGETLLQSTEVALSNALVTSGRRVNNNFQQARNYQRVAEMNRRLLETELARLEAGQSDSRKVLDTEERLTEALESEAAGLTRFMVANIELELSAGLLLQNRDMDPMDVAKPDDFVLPPPQHDAEELPPHLRPVRR